MRTLLVGGAKGTWKSWLTANRKKADWLCLDPSEPTQSPVGRLVLWKDDKPARWRFYGSLDPNRAPHVWFAALVQLLDSAGEDCIVQLPVYRPSPLMRQMALLAAEWVRPDVIYVAHDACIDLNGFPTGPVEVELEEGFPPMVRSAQRKAQWLKFIERCESQTLELRQVTLEGSRLGVGTRLSAAQLADDHAVYGEVAGPTLTLVSDRHFEDADVSRLLDVHQAQRAHLIRPSDYRDVFCSLARENGDDFALGLIQEVDFEAGVIHLLSDAVPPAPARLLRLGALRVDPNGNELGETRPWSV